MKIQLGNGDGNLSVPEQTGTSAVFFCFNPPYRMIIGVDTIISPAVGNKITFKNDDNGGLKK